MKRKGKNSILVYPGLRYTHKKLNFACKIIFFEKCLFVYENQFAVAKKLQKKFWGQIQKHFRHQKNASHTFSIYGNCMISIFRQKVFVFYSVRYTEFYA